MRFTLKLALLVSSAAIGVAQASTAPAEDDAHRLDRLETKKLNERSAAILAASSSSRPVMKPAESPGLREREEEAIARWRATKARCAATPDPHDC